MRYKPKNVMEMNRRKMCFMCHFNVILSQTSLILNQQRRGQSLNLSSQKTKIAYRFLASNCAKKVMISLGAMVTTNSPAPSRRLSSGIKKTVKRDANGQTNANVAFSPVSWLLVVFHFHLCRLLMSQVPVRERSSSDLTSPMPRRTSCTNRK